MHRDPSMLGFMESAYRVFWGGARSDLRGSFCKMAESYFGVLI